MGDPMTFLTVEPTGGREDTVEEALAAWGSDRSAVVRREGTVGAQYYGHDPDRAESVLRDITAAVDRALLLTVRDWASGAGTGRVFARSGDDLVRIETVTGGEYGGEDVVDYVRRHHGLDELGRHAGGDGVEVHD